VIKAGTVFTVTETDDAELAAREGWVECGDDVAVGDTWDGQVFAPPVKSAEEVRAEILAKVDARLNDFAQSRIYDDIKSLASYAGDPDPTFNAEGTYGQTVRSQTYRTLYTILADVQSGARPMPSGYAEIEPELPPLAWPQ
jgi:hypothetical protein